MCPVPPASSRVTAANADADVNFAANNYNSLSLGAVGSVAYGGTIEPGSNGYLLGGGGGTLACNTQLTGTNSLTVGGGTVVLTNTANNYSGITAVAGGTLKLGANNALPTAAVLNLSAAHNSTFDLNGYSQQIAGFWVYSPWDTTSIITNSSAAPATLTISGSTGPYGGAMTGNMSLVMAGSGVLTLGAFNAYTGATVLSSGAIALSGSAALQNSTLSLGGGTLNFGSLTAVSLGGLEGAGNLALTNTNSAAVALVVGGNGATTTYSGSLGGAASLTKIGGGGLTLSGREQLHRPDHHRRRHAATRREHRQPVRRRRRRSPDWELFSTTTAAPRGPCRNRWCADLRRWRGHGSAPIRAAPPAPS